MKIIHFLSLLSFLIILGCSSNSNAPSSSIEEAFDHFDESAQREKGVLNAQSATYANSPVPAIESRKLIWTANLTFQVKNVQKSTSAIQQLCDKHEGFIADMRMSTNNYRISNSVTIRVPNNKFSALLESIKGQSIFMDESSINSNDVTEEYVDIQSRLKTKREVRDRYIEILNTKTGSVKDIIEAEEAIRVITEEIEAKEGRLRYLEDQVSLSTITLEIYQKVNYKAQPTVYEKPFTEEMSDAFSAGWNFIQHFFLVLINIWPLLLLLTILGIWQRKLIKKIIHLIRS